MMPLPALEELIPHRAPMNLLDRIRFFEEPTIECEVRIRADSMFVRDGRIHAVVALEYMAQACAAYSGLVLRSRGNSERIGFLVTVPKLELSSDYFYVGDELLVRATPVYRGIEAGAFDCELDRDGQCIATAKLVVVGREQEP